MRAPVQRVIERELASPPREPTEDSKRRGVPAVWLRRDRLFQLVRGGVAGVCATNRSSGAGLRASNAVSCGVASTTTGAGATTTGAGAGAATVDVASAAVVVVVSSVAVWSSPPLHCTAIAATAKAAKMR